jgi:predicted PurR-regulated permease PerM
VNDPGSGPQRSRVGGWPIAAALAVLAIILYAVRYALLPFVFSAAIAFVADPLITGMQRRLGTPRWPIAVVLYIGFLAILIAAVHPVAVTAAHDVTHLIADGPNIIRHLADQVLSPQGIAIFGKHYTPDQLVNYLLTALTKLIGVNFAAQIAGAGISLIFAVSLTLILTPYLMISGPRLAAGAIWLVPPERRHSVLVVLPRIIPALRRYLVGIVFVVSYTALAAWLGFDLAFGLPHPLLLAVTVGILELIPVVGPLTAATIVGLVAVQQRSLWSAAFLMAFAIGLRLSIDNLVGPLVLGTAARLHPVVVIMAFVCGAMLFGIVGLLLAVPVAVCIKITLTHYYAEPVADSRKGP